MRYADRGRHDDSGGIRYPAQHHPRIAPGTSVPAGCLVVSGIILTAPAIPDTLTADRPYGVVLRELGQPLTR